MDERMDLSALEPDEAQRELLVAGVMFRATGELARRAAADVSPIMLLSNWLRPALAAAAVVAALCASVLSQRELAHVEPGMGLTDALEVPAPVNEWLISDRAPTVADLLVTLDEGTR